MNKLEELYTKDYYGTRMDWKPSQYNILARTFINTINPKSVVDVGCGNGVLLAGVPGDIKVLGIEGSENGVKQSLVENSKILCHDLRTELNIQDRFDLVVSIEVAEHIEPKYADTFVDNLIILGDTIILTASNEQSPYHFNCQPKDYWVGLFNKRFFERDIKTETTIVSVLENTIDSSRDYLYKNMMVFKRK
jgi:SAM-dependent methyltransferase